MLDKYHFIQGTLDECVRDTVCKILWIAAKDSLEYFGIYYGKALIGFTVIGKSFLLSFGINIRYRRKEVLLDWWRKVCDLLDNEFATWIFKKNERTVKFLQRNGMEIVEDDPEKEFYNLIYI